MFLKLLDKVLNSIDQDKALLHIEKVLDFIEEKRISSKFVGNIYNTLETAIEKIVLWSLSGDTSTYDEYQARQNSNQAK